LRHCCVQARGLPCIRSSLHPRSLPKIAAALTPSALIHCYRRRCGSPPTILTVVDFPATRSWTLTDYTGQVWYRVCCFIRTGTADYLQSSLLITFPSDQDCTSSLPSPQVRFRATRHCTPQQSISTCAVCARLDISSYPSTIFLAASETGRTE
jgi:hypothetical protein